MDEETMRNAITDEICKCAFLAGYSEGVPWQAARGCWTKDEITDFAESLGIFEDFEKIAEIAEKAYEFGRDIGETVSKNKEGRTE